MELEDALLDGRQELIRSGELETQRGRDKQAHAPNPLIIMPLRDRRLLPECEMITADGPCGEPAVYQDIYRESIYCPEHGSSIASLPDVVDKVHLAREMVASSLVGLSTEAVSALRDILVNPDTHDAIRLKASTEVLDRTGFGKNEKLTVEMSTQEQELHEASAADLIRERLNRLAGNNDDNVLEFNQDRQKEIE